MSNETAKRGSREVVPTGSPEIQKLKPELTREDERRSQRPRRLGYLEGIYPTGNE